MKILVSGGTGFIGRRLVPELKGHGHEVLVLTRNIERAQSIFGLRTRCVLADSELPKIDGIIHLAGESIAQRWTETAKKRIKTSRIEGTRRLIDQAKSSDRSKNAL